MNQYPPHQEDSRYPNQRRPANQPPSWGNAGWDNSQWGNQQGQPQPGDPYAPDDGYGQYGQYAPPSQQPQSGYGQYGEQGEYGQYGPPSHSGQTQPGWGPPQQSPYGAYGLYGQYGQYGAPSQQSPYMPNAAPPPPYRYPAPGEQDLDYGYADDPPRKSRKGLYTILSIFGVIIVIMVACGVLVNSPPPAPENTASIAGTWYGRTDLADGTGTQSVEAFMNLQQNGVSITGSGKLCGHTHNAATQYITLKITGSMSGTRATLTWHDIAKSDSSVDPHLEGTLTNGTLSLIGQDSTETFTLGSKRGTQQEFLDACRALPQV